ncbi:integral membrane protein [Colletotrichum nymphaeae SA-01]|uniref:Integral membrane protein n=1 Tax=Colletotrichum nymphaeae SA-01 TaxID=1460502 RepID=A0A135UL80_9PEZI|nr:integral membrane protein [Colletotrichum nymphaeae SA-01]
MGLTDTPPPHVPSWVVPTSGALLITGAIFWDMCYVLMSIRSHRTKSYGMPLFALALNLSWELIYAVRVAEHPLERLGFLVWLLLDVPLVYTTLKNAKHEWRHAPLVANNIGAFLAIMVALGCVGNYAVADWWLSAPGTGYGDKSGKWWAGREGFDCTELAFWTAGLAQFALGTGCLAMLLVRGHSGGASYAIW